jgi:hypothetical protein
MANAMLTFERAPELQVVCQPADWPAQPPAAESKREHWEVETMSFHTGTTVPDLPATGMGRLIALRWRARGRYANRKHVRSPLRARFS